MDQKQRHSTRKSVRKSKSRKTSPPSELTLATARPSREFAESSLGRTAASYLLTEPKLAARDIRPGRPEGNLAARIIEAEARRLVEKHPKKYQLARRIYPDVPPETALNRYKSAIRHHREKIARRVRELMGG